MAAKQLVLGIVGLPASGKTVVADHLAKKPGAVRIHTGDFIWEFLKKRGIKPTEESGVMATLFMWAEYGDLPVATWILRQMAKYKAKKIIIIDALRTVEETRILKDKFKDKFKLIAVLSPPTIRWERERKRARFGPLSRLEFRIRDREDLRVGVGDLIANADYYIDASGSIAQNKTATDEVLKKIK